MRFISSSGVRSDEAIAGLPVSRIRSSGYWRIAKRTRHALRARRPLRAFENIPGRIHPNDTMFVDGPMRYLAVGQDAIANIESALDAGDRTWRDVTSVLDLGCGYGRVLRHIARRVDGSTITATDVEAAAARFCASEFGARPLLSTPELDQLGSGYDLIWAGSLFTHVRQEQFEIVAHALPQLLRPGGIFVFSSHGSYALENISRYGRNGQFVPYSSEIGSRVADEGIVYVPYESRDDGYGICWTSEDFVTETMEVPGMRRIMFRPHGWDEHQDVFAFRRDAG